MHLQSWTQHFPMAPLARVPYGWWQLPVCLSACRWVGHYMTITCAITCLCVLTLTGFDATFSDGSVVTAGGSCTGSGNRYILSIPLGVSVTQVRYFMNYSPKYMDKSR
jgi:hypothetical protein